MTLDGDRQMLLGEWTHDSRGMAILYQRGRESIVTGQQQPQPQQQNNRNCSWVETK